MKCPCEICLVVSFCKNKSNFRPSNFRLILNECIELQKYLGIVRLGLYVSSLRRFELFNRLRTVTKIIPYDHITISCEDDLKLKRGE
ncbi:MAG: hypothetical protein ACFFG0_00525 [Candidatus Thorarchaeota archaeon]